VEEKDRDLAASWVSFPDQHVEELAGLSMLNEECVLLCTTQLDFSTIRRGLNPELCVAAVAASQPSRAIPPCNEVPNYPKIHQLYLEFPVCVAPRTSFKLLRILVITISLLRCRLILELQS
jgi:hypothetical protein